MHRLNNLVRTRMFALISGVLSLVVVAGLGVVRPALAATRSTSSSSLGSKPAPHPVPKPSPRHWGGPRVSLGGHAQLADPLASNPANGSSSLASTATSATCIGTLTNCSNNPVMSNVVLYAIFWDPSNTLSASYKSLIGQSLEDIGGPYYGTLTQYGVNNAVNYGGMWVDSNAYQHAATTTDPLQDSNMQQAVTDALNANPTWQQPSLSTIYLVFLGSNTQLCANITGVNSCTFFPSSLSPSDAFCAYHSSFTMNGSDVIYGAMPYDGDRLEIDAHHGCGLTLRSGSPGPNSNESADSEISTMTHEVFEAATDPLNNAWKGTGGEIGDLCQQSYGTIDGDKGNITLNGDRYLVQGEWSNSAGACVEPSGAVLPIPSNSGCTANTLPANDDGSTAQVTLPFTVDFFGQSFSSLWVNNNGNVTFDAPLATYTPFDLLSTQHSIIAPFFGDVDTRGTTPVASGLVTYGTTTYGGQQAFCVNWLRVGYYGDETNKLNSFQLLLVNRPDVAAGDFDIIFNTDKIQWETGDASGGLNGLGGSSTRVGFSNGTTGRVGTLRLSRKRGVARLRTSGAHRKR